MTEGDYELQKQLDIRDALVQDLESKNKALRESMTSSTRKMGDLEEKLSVADSVNLSKLASLNSELEESLRHGKEETALRAEAESTLSLFRVSNSRLVMEFKEQVSLYESTVSKLEEEKRGLRAEVMVLKEERSVLKMDLDAARRRGRVLVKLEEMMEQFDVQI